MKFLQGIFSRIKDWFSGIWEKTEKRDRTRFLVISGIAVVLIFAALFMLNSGKYIEVASSGNPLALRAAASALSENGISNKTSGNSIQVNKNDESFALAVLAQSDVPIDELDLSIYEMGTGLTSTAADRTNYYWYQKERHLKNMFEGMPIVSMATVIIEIPDNKGFFPSELKPPTATVVLHLVPSADVRPAQIETMEKIVMNATGIDPENITLSDQNMRFLNKRDEETTNTTLMQQHEFVKTFQSELESDYSRMLGLLYGPNNFTVKVSARFNFDGVSSRVIEFTPVVDDQGIERSVMTIDEYAKGLGFQGGFPGTEENGIGDEYVEIMDQLMSEYKRIQQTINYEINESVSSVDRQPAVLEEIGVSVTINSDGLEATDQNTAALKALIGDTLPYDSIVEVHYLPMFGLRLAADKEQEFKDIQRREEMFALVQTLTLYGIIGICVILLILRAFALLKPPVVEVPAEMLAGDAEDYAELLESATASMELEVTKTPSRERIEEFIESNPEAVAAMLRSWLQEEDDRGW